MKSNLSHTQSCVCQLHIESLQPCGRKSLAGHSLIYEAFCVVETRSWSERFSTEMLACTSSLGRESLARIFFLEYNETLHREYIAASEGFSTEWSSKTGFVWCTEVQTLALQFVFSVIRVLRDTNLHSIIVNRRDGGKTTLLFLTLGSTFEKMRENATICVPSTCPRL